MMTFLTMSLAQRKFSTDTDLRPGTDGRTTVRENHWIATL
jgi:hypothetical protein